MFINRDKKGLRGKFGVGKEKQATKIFFMPRGDYLKYFARDTAGAYTGSEPQREWVVQELEECFGRYRKSWVKE